jgi:hypothetical protein
VPSEAAKEVKSEDAGESEAVVSGIWFIELVVFRFQRRRV